MTRLRSLFIVVVIASLLGCTSSKDGDARLLVLVAASTDDAVREAAAAFTKESGVEVRISADDSSALAMQITNGAPADLFLSANEKWADALLEKGLVGRRTNLLGNTLVLVVPKGNPAKVVTPQDLTAPAVKKVALAGPTVPAGIYGREALSHLKLVAALEKEKKIVSGENVRVTLTYVERGEVEAGIVYATDARITDKVEVVATFAADTHMPIVYPLVLLKSAQNKPNAVKFYDYLQSPAATAIFQKYGFTRPGQ